MTNKKVMTEVQDTILCPSVILRMRHTLSVVQMRILIAIITSLQGFIRKQVNGLRRQGSHLYPSEQLYKDHVILYIPLSQVMGVQKSYAIIRKALMKMRDTPVGIPIDKGSQWTTVSSLIDVIMPTGNEQPHPAVCIHHTIVDHLFDITTGYYRFSLAAYLSCRKRSSQIMYLFCEQWRSRGTVHLSMHTLINMLGAEDTYRRFSSFRNKYLDAAEQELRDLYRERRTTCYFSYHPNYQGSNLRGEPSTVTFHIHVVQSAANAQCSEEQMQATVAALLSRHFELYPSQVKTLTARVDKWNYQEVIEKLHELQCRFRMTRNIRDPRAYTYAVITRLLDASTPTRASQEPEETQLNLSA